MVVAGPALVAQHSLKACLHSNNAATCGAPSFQFVLLGVCLGEDLTGVESLKASFQSRSTKGLDMFMVSIELELSRVCFVEAI